MLLDNGSETMNMINPDTDKLAVGLKQTVRSVSEGRAAKVFLADDCEEHIRTSVKQSCSLSGIEIVNIPTMRCLGKMCGIDVKASCASLLRK